MIEKYLKTTYKRGGRGPQEYDCWGLVREVRHEVFGRDLLPELTDATPGNPRAITKGRNEVHCTAAVVEVPMRPGAVAEAWCGSLCVHVGVVVEVDGRLMILETDTPHGPCLTAPGLFASRYTRVMFFDDQP